jgi:ribosomal protein S8
MVILSRLCQALNKGIKNRSLQVFVPSSSLNRRVLNILLENNLIIGYTIAEGKVLILLRYTNGNPSFTHICPVIASRKLVFKGKLDSSWGFSSSTQLSLVKRPPSFALGVPIFSITY